MFIPRKLWKTLLFGVIWDKFTLKSPLKEPFFWALKVKYLRNHLAKLKKWAHSEILMLRAFKWCKNQIIFKKFQFWLPTYSVKDCVYSFSLKHALTFFFLMLSRSFFIVNVLRHFQWYFMFGTTLSGKFDATSKTAWWWRVVAVFNNVFHNSMDWMLTKLHLESVQYIMQASEIELPFDLGPGTHSSSFSELIIC